MSVKEHHATAIIKTNLTTSTKSCSSKFCPALGERTSDQKILLICAVMCDKLPKLRECLSQEKNAKLITHYKAQIQEQLCRHDQKYCHGATQSFKAMARLHSQGNCVVCEAMNTKKRK